MNYAIEILLEQKTLIESELVHTEGAERTELERRLIDTANALNKLNLPDVVGQSEQCTHENEVQRQGDGFVYTICGNCGKDLD